MLASTWNGEEGCTGEGSGAGQPAWSAWRGVEDLTWSQDKGHWWIEAVGLWGRSLPLWSLLLSEPMSQETGLPFPAGHGSWKSSHLGVSLLPGVLRVMLPEGEGRLCVRGHLSRTEAHTGWGPRRALEGTVRPVLCRCTVKGVPEHGGTQPHQGGCVGL